MTELLDTANTPAFDFSGLDSITINKLVDITAEYSRHRDISLQEYVQACISVANAHDLLANHYGGKWGEWYTAQGLSEGSALNMHNVGKKVLSSATVAELAETGNIGKRLLQLISAPNAPAELEERVTSGEITTAAEYKKLLAEVESRDAKIAELLNAGEIADRKAEQARLAAEDAEARAAELARKLADRPVEVHASPSPEEAQRLRREGEEAGVSKMETVLANVQEKRKKAQDEADTLRRQNFSLTRQIEDLHNQLDDAPMPADMPVPPGVVTALTRLANTAAANIEAITANLTAQLEPLCAAEYERAAAATIDAAEYLLTMLRGGISARKAKEEDML